MIASDAPINDIIRECIRLEMEIADLEKMWLKEFKLANKDKFKELEQLRHICAIRLAYMHG